MDDSNYRAAMPASAHRVPAAARASSPVRLLTVLSLALLLVAGHDDALAGEGNDLDLKTMGAYSFSGTVRTNAAGQTLHCDHGYAEFFIPKSARKLPIVMWHSSSTKTWQTTFDNREGWQPIFLRRRFPVYLIDLPRQGRASWGCEPVPGAEMPTLGRDQSSFSGFRFGTWTPPGQPVYFPGVQESNSAEVLNEMLRTRYPELNGSEAEQFESEAVRELLNKIGPAILMTHSGSAIRGFWTAVKNPEVKGIVAVEGGQLFPEGDAPAGATTIPQSDFMKLTKFPILIILGDNLEGTPAGQQSIARARAFVQAVNSRGGNATLLYLPEQGIRGNTHFSMSDVNNVQVADLVSKFLKKNGLDRE